MAKQNHSLWISQALALPSKRQIYRNQPIMLRKDPQLINLLSQTRTYAHEIVFTGHNPRNIRVAALLNKNNGAVGTCRMAIWPKGSNASPGSHSFHFLNENKKMLWMKKGKSMDLSIQNL